MTKKLVLLALACLIASPTVFAQGFAVTTLTATAVGSSSATLVGRVTYSPCVTPGPTNTYFVLDPIQGGNGRVDSVDSQEATQYAPSDGSCAIVTDTVVASVWGLSPSTTYLFHAVADNNFHVEGNTAAFTTLAAGAPFLDPGYGTMPIPGSGNLKGVAGDQAWVDGEGFVSSTQVFLDDVLIGQDDVVVVSDRQLHFRTPGRLAIGLVRKVRVVNNGVTSNEVPFVVVPPTQ